MPVSSGWPAMVRGSWRALAPLVPALWIWSSSPPALAHEVPVERVVDGFVKVEEGRLELLVRVPLDLLGTIRFPAAGQHVDLQAAGPALNEALAAIGQAVTVFENGTPVPPTAGTARLSLPADQAFGEYGRAVEHIARSASPGTVIYSNQGYVDAHLRYSIRSPQSMFAVRSRLDDLGGSVKLSVQYLPMDGGGRQFVIAREAGRVAFNPTPYEAGRRFFVLGVSDMLTSVEYLVLIGCLVLPLRTLRDLAPTLAAVVAGHSATLIGTALNPTQVGPWLAAVVHTIIAAAVAYIAIENIAFVTPRGRWVAGGVLGVISGLGLSSMLRDDLQFAGSHLFVSSAAFHLGVETGRLLVVAALAGTWVLLAHRRVAGRIGIVLLSAFAAHDALHWTVERATVLWQGGLPEAYGDSLLVLARWLAGVVAALSVARVLARRLESRPPVA